ncbi:MAG: DUF4034 domain-containing protein [Planctomycetes bacterium]|nr:DUF4034 domain-containing protein [Planctomycetota bacterium]
MRSLLPRLAPLLALTLAACPEGAAPAAPPPSAAARPRPPAPWPPVKGEPVPDLALLDARGETVRLSELGGRVLLVEPVGMSCAGCQAYSGGDVRGGFGGVTPQRGLSSIDDVLRAAGVDPDHPDLLLVQVLCFDLSMGTPTVADARAWAEHFGLDRRANALVLVGDDLLREDPATVAMVPGFLLVDRDGTLLLDATPASPEPDDLHADLAPRVAALLGAGRPLEVEAPAVALCPPEEHPEVTELAPRRPFLEAAAARRFEAMDAELDRLRALGRLEGTLHEWPTLALDALLERPAPATLELLDAWVAARPASAWALGARGELYIRWAWAARGGGYADTVSEDGWRLFGERLRRARQDLEAALELDPAADQAATSLVTVARGLNLPRSAALRWFEAARAAAPGRLQPYRMTLVYLMPKWHGDVEVMWAFARTAVAAHPDDPAFLLLLDEAHAETARMQRDRAAYDRERRHELDDLHRRVLERYPRRWQSWRRRAALAKLAGARAEELAHAVAAAEAGDPWWQALIGDYLVSGAHRPHVPRDVERGLRLLCRAAHQGRADAQVDLGEHLEEGRHGLARDPAAAAALYERAAAGGSDMAMAALARCSLAGHGGPRDPARALRLYEQAAEAAEKESWRAFHRLRARDLKVRGGPRAVRHPDGFDDWYPDDVAPPDGQEYPCALTPLPRALEGIPPEERRFVNHLAAVALDATRSKLVFFRDQRWGAVPRSALDVLRADLGELHARLAAEEAPDGLAAVRDDVLAALDLLARFCARHAEAMLPERARIDGLPKDEATRRWRALNARVFPSIPEGREASARLQAAWAKLSARYEGRWAPAVKDSLFHHLCALDLY